MGDNVISLAEIRADNIHCSVLIDPSCHVTIKGYEIGEHDFPLLNACWLLQWYSFPLHPWWLPSEWSAQSLFQGWGWQWLLSSSILLLALFGGESNIGLPPFIGTSPILHDFSKIMEICRETTCASSFSSHGCIPSGPMDLWMFSLPSQPITQTPTTREQYSFLQPSSLASEIWDSWGLSSAVKTEA